MKRLLLLLCVCFSASAACRSFAEVSMRVIPVAQNGASDYAIVIPADSNVKSLMRSLANCVAEYVLAKTGAALPVVDDDALPGGPCIYIGDTACAPSVALAGELEARMYAIDVLPGGDIVIGGADVNMVVHAVDRFVADVLITRPDNAVVVAAESRVSGTLRLSDWEAEGAVISNRMRSVSFKGIKSQKGSTSALKSVRGIRPVMMLTGEYSINNTRSLANVPVGDIGAMCLHNGKLYFFFGDTLGGAQGNQFLISNSVAYTTDFDYTDGIRFDGYLCDARGNARPVTQGAFGVSEMANVEKGHEYTRIPTGAISIDGKLYMNFMSVAVWLGDDWICNFGGIMVSDDDGATWTECEARWPGDTKFCQMYPALNPQDGYVYVVGITGGRVNPARMMRVPSVRYGEFDAYEYLTGYDDEANPQFTAGSEGLYSDFALIPGQVWEPCMMYSEYLDEWIITYKDAAALRLYTAKDVAGPYALTVSIPYPHGAGAGYYAVYTHPALTSRGGEKVGFLMSYMHATGGHVAANIWNIELLEMTLVK